MSKPSQFMDDIAQLAGGAAGLLSSVQSQMKEDIKTRVEEMASRLDLVPREEFERVEDLLKKALADQKEMMARIEALEKKKK